MWLCSVRPTLRNVFSPDFTMLNFFDIHFIAFLFAISFLYRESDQIRYVVTVVS